MCCCVFHSYLSFQEAVDNVVHKSHHSNENFAKFLMKNSSKCLITCLMSQDNIISFKIENDKAYCYNERPLVLLNLDFPKNISTMKCNY